MSASEDGTTRYARVDKYPGIKQSITRTYLDTPTVVTFLKRSCASAHAEQESTQTKRRKDIG